MPVITSKGGVAYTAVHLSEDMTLIPIHTNEEAWPVPVKEAWPVPVKEAWTMYQSVPMKVLMPLCPVPLKKA